MAFNDEIVRLLANRSAYLDFSHRNNAGAVDWPDPLVKLYGKIPDSRGDYPIEGTVMGFGTLTRAVCNADFALEIPSITIELIDPDHFWRSRAAFPINLLLRWVQLYLRVGRAVMQPLDPMTFLPYYDQRISVGQITKADFGPAKHVSLECQLTGGKHLGEMIPRRTVTLTDFPRCPPESIGKAVPIVFGLFSNAIDAYGNPIEVTAVGCHPRNHILMQESWANGNGLAFNDYYVYERWLDDPDDDPDPPDPLYPKLGGHEANYVWVDYPLVGYGVNVLWLQKDLDPYEYYLYAGCAFRWLDELPWGGYDPPSPSNPYVMFDASDVWMAFTYYPNVAALTDHYGSGRPFFYSTILVTWDDAGYTYGLMVEATDSYYDTANYRWPDPDGWKTDDVGAWIEITIPTARSYFPWLNNYDDPSDDDTVAPGREEFFVKWANNRIDLKDIKQAFTVCWKCGTYTYDPTPIPPDPSSSNPYDRLGYPEGRPSVAKDGYFRLYINGKLLFAKENHDLVLEEGWWMDAGHDHANQQETLSFGWSSQVGPLTDITITNGVEETPVPKCQDDPGTSANLASGALRALLVDTGKMPTGPDAVGTPIHIDTSLPLVVGHEAHNVFGGGSINKAVFFYVAARKEDGTIGPIGAIADLDNAYDPAQEAHAASLSWWKEGDATAYVVWMFQDPNFHPVDRPTLGSPRTKIIKAINHSQFPPINESDPPFDYQVKFTSLQDGAAYGAGASEGYRYLLAGHALQGVDQVYVLKPMPTIKNDAPKNVLQGDVAAGAGTIRVVFDSDNNDIENFQKDNVVIITGDPEPYTILNSDEGVHGISPPARQKFTTGTVIAKATDEDTQVLQKAGVDYRQEIIEVNNNRYHTLVFPTPQQNVETCAQYEVSANVRGSEIDSDGTGLLINHGVSIVQHFFKNWIFNDYRSSIGAFAPTGNKWFEDVAYSPGLINNASFYAANLVAAGRMGLSSGSYIGAGALTEQIPASQLIYDLITSFDLDLYFDTSSGVGAWSVAMLNTEEIIRSTAPEYVPETDTIRDTFAIEFGLTPHANILPYLAGPMTGRLVGQTNDDTGGYIIGNEVHDAESIALWGTLTAEPLELKWTRHALTAYDVAMRRLRMIKHPAAHARMTVPIGSVNDSLGTVVALTHPDGLGPDGWVQRLCRVMRSDVDLDRMVLHLLLRDIDALVGP